MEGLAETDRLGIFRDGQLPAALRMPVNRPRHRRRLEAIRPEEPLVADHSGAGDEKQAERHDTEAAREPVSGEQNPEPPPPAHPPVPLINQNVGAEGRLVFPDAGAPHRLPPRRKSSPQTEQP